MSENVSYFKNKNIFYYPYVEMAHNAGRGLLSTLSKNACVVITDDFPVFFIPRMAKAASKKVPVLMEAIDSNGILPMRAAQKVFLSAYSFRRFLQNSLPDQLLEIPEKEPLKKFQLPRLKKLPKWLNKTR